ncbi:hypothetical protein NMY22_g15922 [Coprinellus aureogranulatus]|nr:hypothetical protein NMY22_g15922 [Coprinellus aureogranulatus]
MQIQDAVPATRSGALYPGRYTVCFIDPICQHSTIPFPLHTLVLEVDNRASCLGRGDSIPTLCTSYLLRLLQRRFLAYKESTSNKFQFYPVCLLKRSLQPGRKPRVVSTLDPKQLRPKDVINIAGILKPKIHLRLSSLKGTLNPSSSVTILYRFLQRSGNPTSTPFPTECSGFLYFRHSPNPHPTAGEIRFRVIPPGLTSLSPGELFSRGSDLISYDGYTPWRIHLINVFKRYPNLHRSVHPQAVY